MRENIYINKKGDNKYEIITKEVNFEPGVYNLFTLEKNLFVIKKRFYKESNYPKKETQSTNQKNTFQREEKKEDKNSTQTWYKKALELKKKLMQDGFLVIQDVEEVRKISYVTRQEINSGEILGIRGFDKKYYILTKTSFEKIKSQILDSMASGTITYDELIENIKVPKEELNGAIELLKEQSDIIEVHKNIFKKV